MRLWLSLATLASLAGLALSDWPWPAVWRYYYEPCPEEKVCIFFDYDTCHSVTEFRGYLWDKDFCTQTNGMYYGRNYAGLEIQPNPPNLWKVKMTIVYCHMDCDNEKVAPKIGISRLSAAQFNFGGFTVSFPDDTRANVTWKDNKTSEFRMKRQSVFWGWDHKYWPYYNVYEFDIYSKREKLIDLVNGDIAYYGFVLEEDENISASHNHNWTKLKEPDSFRTKLGKFNDCDMDTYPFNADSCPADSACVKVLNNPINKICAIGELQYSSNRQWTVADKLKCANNQWSYERMGTITPIQKFGHARCVVTEPCSLQIPLKLENCFNPNDCATADLRNNRDLKCDAGFDLEVKLNDDWMYHKDVRCYGDYLSLMDINNKFIDTVENIRCRKQRTCDLSKFFNFSKCERNEHCLMPSDNTYSCENGYELQYTSIAEPTSWKLLDKIECIENQLRLTIGSKQSDLVPLNVRCMIEKKCDLKLFMQPANECGNNNICVEPLGSNNEITCPAEFGLQAELKPNEWKAAKITCNENEELFVDRNKEVPLQIRCIRKNVSKFFDENDCEGHEMCKEPKKCDSMKCEFGDQNPLWNLQFKSARSIVWSDVQQSVECNSEKFVVDNVPGTDDLSFKFRCVLSKCTLCKDPCPNCVIDSSFDVSNKWNECAKFSCGPNTRTIFGVGDNTSEIMNFECSNFDNGASFWKHNGSSEAKKLEIKCEKLCSLQSPLISSCPANSTDCKAHESGDFERFSCGRSMYADIGNFDRLHINKLKCDKHDGSWKAENVNGDKEVIIPEGSNVYCYEGECDFSRIFPSCESDDNECTDYDKEDHRITCKVPFTFWSRYRFDEDWTEMKGVSELQCLAGSIVENGKRKNYDFQANCRMLIPKAAAAKSKLALYLGLMFLVLLLTVVIIATIIIRVSGKGWLHTIVIEMIRRRNKKRARSHSSASSLPKSNHSQTPIAKSPMTNSSSKKTQKASPSSKSKSSSKNSPKATGRPSSSLSSVQASSDGISKMNSVAKEPRKVFVI